MNEPKDLTIIVEGRIVAIIVATEAMAARLYPGALIRERQPGDAVEGA